MKRPVIFFYLLSLLGLFFYSFTQVDLGLTLTRASFFQVIQTSFQHIGYFDRPLSTYLYMLLILLLFACYIFLIRLVREKILSGRLLIRLTIVAAVLLTFSYTAFSYDIFNYVFDAKILTYYHQNPYEHKALDYPAEPMLAFMHWTHRVYPYGPIWLVVTVPLSYIGLNYFLPTYFLFKALAAASYVGSVFLIGKILKKTKPEHELLGMAVFAFNPLVLIEALVGGHNDIVMLFLVLLGIFLLTQKKMGKSLIVLVASIGIKFATVVLFPVYVYVFLKRQNKIHWDKVYLFCLVAMSIALLFVTLRTNYQPWYLLYILPFMSLLSDREYIFLPSLVLSLVSLFLYVPFLYWGNWDPPTPMYLERLEIGGFAAALLIGVVIWYLTRKNSLKTQK